MSWLSTSKVSTTLGSPMAPRTPALPRVAAAPSVPKDSYQTCTQAEELGESEQWLPACSAQAQLGLASASGALWFSCLCRVPPRRAQAPQRCRGYLQSISASARHGEWHFVSCQQGPGGWGRPAKPEPLEMLLSASFLKAFLDTSLVPSFKTGVLLLLLPPSFSECLSQAPSPLKSLLLRAMQGLSMTGIGGESRCLPVAPGLLARPLPLLETLLLDASTAAGGSRLERRGLLDTLTGDRPGAAASAVSRKWGFSPST